MNQMNNQMNRNRYNDVIEIDLAVFCKKALKKWKLLLLICLIGALAGAGLAEARYWWKETHQPEFKEEDFIKAKEKLTDKELEEANHVFDQYSTYFRVQEAKSKHINDSKLMALNAETAAVIERSYLIKSNQNDLVKTLESKTLNPTGYQRIAQAIGGDVTDQDVEELVFMKTNDALQNWENIVLEGNVPNIEADAAKTQDGNDKPSETKYTNVIIVTAMGEDEAFCEKLLSETETLLSEAINDLATVDDSISMTSFGEEPVKDGSETLLERQQLLLESVTTIIDIRKKFVQDIVSKLTKNQTKYFEQLQLRDNAKEPESKESRGMVKFAAVGLFLGIIVFCMILCIPVMFGGHYQSAGELESVTGIRLLAKIKKDSFNEEDTAINDAAKMIAAELRAWEKDDNVKFFFAADERFKVEHPFLRKLQGEYAKDTLRIGNPLTDPEAMASMLDSKGILLGISVEDSKRVNVKRICCTASDHDIPVLGYVAEDAVL